MSWFDGVHMISYYRCVTDTNFITFYHHLLVHICIFISSWPSSHVSRVVFLHGVN